VSDESYRRALEDALREYEQILQQRAELDVRRAQLLQTIGTLSRLCKLVPTVPLGLTDACRMALRAAGHPLTAAEIRDHLGAMGFEWSAYSNPLASIHTVLKRLQQAGEVQFTPRPFEKPAYTWRSEKGLERPPAPGPAAARTGARTARRKRR
jgi:hypothetical protein